MMPNEPPANKTKKEPKETAGNNVETSIWSQEQANRARAAQSADLARRIAAHPAASQRGGIQPNTRFDNHTGGHGTGRAGGHGTERDGERDGANGPQPNLASPTAGASQVTSNHGSTRPNTGVSKQVSVADTNPKGGPKRGPESSPKSGSAPGAMGRGIRLSLELPVAIGVGTLIGTQLDRWLGTSPLFLIGFVVLGFGGGIFNIIRIANGDNVGIRGKGKDEGGKGG